MAIALNGTPGRLENAGFSTNTPTWSAVVASGSNQILIVTMSINNDNWSQLSGVTYGGVSMTLAVQNTSSIANRVNSIYYLLNPTVGTANCVATFSTSSNNDGLFTGSVFSGVDQTTPFGTSAETNSGSVSSPLSTSITCAAGEVAIAAGMFLSGTSPALSGSQTALGSIAPTKGALHSYLQDATAMGFSWTGGATQASQIVIPLKVASGGGGGGTDNPRIFVPRSFGGRSSFGI